VAQIGSRGRNYLEEAGARAPAVSMGLVYLYLGEDSSALTAKEHGALAGSLTHNLAYIAGFFPEFAQGRLLNRLTLVDKTCREFDDNLARRRSELLFQQ